MNRLLTIDDSYQVINRKPLVMLIAPLQAEVSRLDLDYYNPQFLNLESQLQASGISRHPLEKLRKANRKITDGIRERDEKKSGVPLVRTQDINDMVFSLESCMSISWAQHQKNRKSSPHPGDLLIAIGGHLGNAALVPEEVPEVNIDRHIAIVPINENLANVAYLWAFITSIYGTGILSREATGTVQRGVKLPNIRNLQVPLPPRPVQEYIGAKVRLAERCRLQARELRREAQQCLETGVGLEIAISNEVAQGREFCTLSLKPEVAEVNPLLMSSRLDPAAYSPVRLALLEQLRDARCEFQPLHMVADDVTKQRRRFMRNQHIVSYFISILHLNDKGFINLDDAAVHYPVSPGIVCETGDILFSGINPSQNRVAVWTTEGQALCSAEFSIYRAKPGVPPHYLSFVWRSIYCLHQLEALTRGTSSSRRRLQEEDFEELMVPILAPSELRLISQNEQSAVRLDILASKLIAESKADVEALIEKRLDVQGILTGHVQAPSWETLNLPSN